MSNKIEKYDVFNTLFETISEIIGSAPAKKSTTGRFTPDLFNSLQIKLDGKLSLYFL